MNKLFRVQDKFSVELFVEANTETEALNKFVIAGLQFSKTPSQVRKRDLNVE